MNSAKDYNVQRDEEELLNKAADDHADVPAADSPYGWVMVLLSFLLHFSSLGIVYSFGVLLIPITEEFNIGRAEVALVGALTSAVMEVFAGVAGPLVDRFGIRPVVIFGGILTCAGSVGTSYAAYLSLIYICYGLVGGMGLACAFSSGISSVQTWFDKRRGLAGGLGVAGSGIGNFVYSLVINELVNSYGWRWATRIQGIFSGVIMVLCGCFISLRVKVHKKTPPLKTAMMTRGYLIICFFYLIGGSGYYIVYVHLVAFGEDQGFSSSEAALGLALAGVASTIGRVALGAVADRYGILFCLQSCTLAMGIVAGIWPIVATRFWAYLVVAIAFGFVSAAMPSLPPVFIGKHFQGHRISSLIGIMFVAFAPGTLAGPLVAGYIFDQLDSYFWAGIAAGVSFFIPWVAFFFMPKEVSNKT